MKKYGLLATTIISPVIMIICLFAARVYYKNHYYLSHLYPGDSAAKNIGTPTGEMYKTWLMLIFAIILLIVFIVSIIKYLRISRSK
ncbi:hypothetical protein ACYATP_07735 [Lactobacillaceae bacterium Melli_B4]